MTTTLFNEKMKLADIIAANHNLILMLPRLGIALGFGDKSVQQVCQLHNISPSFVLLIFNAYTFDHYRPDTSELARIDMSMLVPYLMASHSYYMDQRIPHIARHLKHVADTIEPRYGRVLEQFLSDYQQQVHLHFEEEEQRVFPLLQRLQQGYANSDSPSSSFIDSHTDIEDRLQDLTQIVYKYLPSTAMPEEHIELIFDILQLSADLEKHAMIEEKIMMPYFSMLSENNKA